MLYLEDYLEMIETLPQDLRDRFTEMREMDLQVQNAMDTLEERVKTLFANAKKMKPEARDEQFEKIRQDYYKALEDADEKVQLANQIYDLVDRHLRKLDQELQKFKMELEADNAGITEILERRSLELDNPTPSGSQHGGKPKTEKRKYVTQTEHQPEKRPASDKLLRTLTNGTPDSPVSYRSNTSTPPTPSLYPSLQQPSPALTLPNLGQIGAGSGAIAAAAAQAVNQTLQMQQGRRTSSLKTTYEVMKNANLTNLGLDFNLGTNYGVTAQANSPSISTADTSRSQRTQKKTPKAAAAAAAAAASTAVPPPAPVETFQPQATIIEEPATSSMDWTFDPNEPRYCICNQVSYGDMVGCDNEDCPIEWFHYGCVGISEPPKGKWYCPQCTAAMKRRGVKQK
ncbi:ING3 [Branchiostoma lanceolatum]|uniref:Inhibitor of growth protein n=1 Tax=Branchiostoma lanceolatum TaxID=7740 RepID=A0A8K0EQS9_BRALA|nr:ING3 [Branchiostoma lanceolatum]